MKRGVVSYIRGKIILHFKKNVEGKEARKIVRDAGIEPVRWLKDIRILIVRVPKGQEKKWMERMRKHKKILTADLSYLKKLSK